MGTEPSGGSVGPAGRSLRPCGASTSCGGSTLVTIAVRSSTSGRSTRTLTMLLSRSQQPACIDSQSAAGFAAAPWCDALPWWCCDSGAAAASGGQCGQWCSDAAATAHGWIARLTQTDSSRPSTLRVPLAERSLSVLVVIKFCACRRDPAHGRSPVNPATGRHLHGSGTL